MKLSQLLNSVEHTILSGSSDIEINGLVYDSRKVKPGDVFVCLKDYNVDAHKFAASAVQSGASAVVLSDVVSLEGVTVIKVDDTRIQTK